MSRAYLLYIIDVGFPNLGWWYLLGWRSGAYHFESLWPWHWLLASFLGFSCYITANFPQMCLMLDQFLWGHSSRVCDISCSLTFSPWKLLERLLEVLEKSFNFTHTCLYEPWMFKNVSCDLSKYTYNDPNNYYNMKLDGKFSQLRKDVPIKCQLTFRCHLFGFSFLGWHLIGEFFLFLTDINFPSSLIG